MAVVNYCAIYHFGDGIFCTVQLGKCIANMISAENNSIFEYGIYTTSKQNEMIEKEIEKFIENLINVLKK